jgi:UDP-N-acetylmuramate-alanine ligase
VVAAEARAGDLILLMGAGDITLVAEELAGVLGGMR